MTNFFRYQRFILLLSFFFVFITTTIAQKALTVSGYIKDVKTGEALIGATVYVRELKNGVATNQYGFYSLSMQPGKYQIDYSYVGYKSVSRDLNLKENVSLTVELSDEAQEISEVVVKADRPEEKIKRAEMSVNKLEMKTIKKIPALMGEVDVIKAIQLLPGVQATSEGSSTFSVRGGGGDQNLILLDEATVYNASHFMGFFSVFNNDAVKDVKLYKGDIPAAFGGRLSSLLDVRMKEGNAKQFTGTGGIGNISSRLTLEGPIIPERGSFLISGRRTYMDAFFPLSSDKAVQDAILYFYDLNMKLNYSIDENNRIYLSMYGGKDNAGNKNFQFGFGNNTVTARWNHQYSGKLFSNVSFIATNYNYKLGMPEGSNLSFIWTSRLSDYTVKTDFNYYANNNNSIKFGFSSSYHIIDPGYITGIGKQTIFNSYDLPEHFGLEHGVYVSNEQNINEWLTVKYGLRASAFQNIGADSVFTFDANHELETSEYIEKNKVFKTHSGLEPRLALNIKIGDKSAVRSSYSRTMQYIQLASNSASGTPLDVWFPASNNVKPQISDQVALGYVRYLFNNLIEASAEVYYKEMQNTIDFRDNAQLFLNYLIEAELRYGRSKAYGAEFMLQLNHEKVNGWISYTLSRSERKISEVNFNKSYVSPYDRTHNINVVLNYNINKRWSVSGNWVFSSGAPVTYPTGFYKYNNVVQKVYSFRNSNRLPDYHRLDISVSLKSKKRSWMFWDGEWNFSVYNAYNRHNAWAVNFIEDTKTSEVYAEKTYLFSIVPSVTYNFNF